MIIKILSLLVTASSYIFDVNDAELGNEISISTNSSGKISAMTIAAQSGTDGITLTGERMQFADNAEINIHGGSSNISVTIENAVDFTTNQYCKLGKRYTWSGAALNKGSAGDVNSTLILPHITNVSQIKLLSCLLGTNGEQGTGYPQFISIDNGVLTAQMQTTGEGSSFVKATKIRIWATEDGLVANYVWSRYTTNPNSDKSATEPIDFDGEGMQVTTDTPSAGYYKENNYSTISITMTVPSLNYTLRFTGNISGNIYIQDDMRVEIAGSALDSWSSSVYGTSGVLAFVGLDKNETDDIKQLNLLRNQCKFYAGTYEACGAVCLNVKSSSDALPSNGDIILSNGAMLRCEADGLYLRKLTLSNGAKVLGTNYIRVANSDSLSYIRAFGDVSCEIEPPVTIMGRSIDDGECSLLINNDAPLLMTGGIYGWNAARGVVRVTKTGKGILSISSPVEFGEKSDVLWTIDTEPWAKKVRFGLDNTTLSDAQLEMIRFVSMPMIKPWLNENGYLIGGTRGFIISYR